MATATLLVQPRQPQISRERKILGRFLNQIVSRSIGLLSIATKTVGTHRSSYPGREEEDWHSESRTRKTRPTIHDLLRKGSTSGCSYEHESIIETSLPLAGLDSKGITEQKIQSRIISSDVETWELFSHAKSRSNMRTIY